MSLRRPAIFCGTILIRNGLIEAVGRDIAAPADARVWDMKGTAIYAGFIDPYLIADGGSNRPVSTTESEPVQNLTCGGVKFYGAPGVRTDMGKSGPSFEVSKISPAKEATFFISSGDMLDIRSVVQRMWISGKEVSLASRQTRLYDKYKNRPRPK